MPDYAEVAVPAPLPGPLTYRVPLGLQPQRGQRVLVPLGRRTCLGVAVEVHDRAPETDLPLRSLVDVVGPRPQLDEELLRFVESAARYAMVPLGEALKVVSPALTSTELRQLKAAKPAPNSSVAALRKLRGVGIDDAPWFRLSNPGLFAPSSRDPKIWRSLGSHQQAIITALLRTNPSPRADLLQQAGAPGDALRRLVQRGLIETCSIELTAHQPDLEPPDFEQPNSRPSNLQAPPAEQTGPAPPATDAESAGPALSAEQQSACAAMLRALASLDRADPTLSKPATALLRKGETPQAVKTTPAAAATAPPRGSVPTSTPAPANTEPLAFLLHGVTGSGKTEVYIEVIKAALRQGYAALVVVPEIVLTPQLARRFRAQLGSEIAVLHSGLSPRARRQAWQDLREGRVRVALGARSAIFAPLARLGVIIVDEEHDASLKQEEGWRYHARDLALLRAALAPALCVLGSATPSLEAYELARRGKAKLLELTTRPTAHCLPTVEILDLRRHRRGGPTGHPLLTAPLVRALEKGLAAGEQSLLFLNRRGFAPTTRCEECGWQAECPACAVTLTEHRGAGQLRCHYCDFQRPVPHRCDSCQSPNLQTRGFGTEELELHLREHFKQARIGRLDRDVASASAMNTTLDRLRKGRLDIVVGTQMIAKGHDFPGVTFVGVLLADQALAFPDFRASERTFQLLSQVVGRAGRGVKPGRALIQSYQPEHYAVVAAKVHDYHGFARREREYRQALAYPPFSRLALIRLHGASEAEVRAKSADLFQKLQDQLRRLSLGVAAQRTETRAGQGRTEAGAFGELRAERSRLESQVYPAARTHRVELLGPAPAPIARLRGKYRYQIMLRSKTVQELRRFALCVHQSLAELPRSVSASLDFEPVSML